MPAPRPMSKDVEDIKKMQTASRASQGVKESYDAYDLVLEYLFSQGHVETLEEANYVMLVMDAETIGTIVEECENDLLAEEITEWVNELVEEGYDLSEYTWEDLAEYYVNEANKAEKMLGLTSRQRERARNLNQYTDKPIFYGTNPNRRKKADNSDPILNKAHKGMTAKRKASHRAGRGTRGDSGESTNVVKWLSFNYKKGSRSYLVTES
jgi:DNA-binding ferritin-like protein (Dps family)